MLARRPEGMDNKPEDTNQNETLEDTSTTVSSSSESNSKDGDSLEGGGDATFDAKAAKSAVKQSFGKRILNLITKLNIYLILFIFIVVLAVGIILIGIQRNKKAELPTTVNTQTLSAEELKKLTESEQKVGDPKSTLSIESNTIFTGKVLVQDSLDVAGTIKVGGSLSLPGISVSGESSFDQIKANNLTITGNTAIQGQLSIQKGITSSGGASFGGPISAPTLTVQSLQISGDLQITRHIDAGGGTPGKVDGTALGSGGTVSVSGSDTAGTITINTGGGPGAGCFVTVNFTQKFSGNPHVVITPVGSAAASLSYYINRNSSNFSVCTANAPGAGQSFSFDYVAID
jgi:cytoskeletal protein CcmA (bactofilin family)